jgi:AcrR family transcriptional regulator
VSDGASALADRLRFAAAKHDVLATVKGERTRAQILDTALRLFDEHGWRETTMRSIAAEAGVSLGNAYYYFRSKESLIQAIYAQSHEEHAAACEAVLARETTFTARLGGVMEARLDTLARYHRFAAALFAAASDSTSPLNPWSEASRPVRASSRELFARVLDGCDRGIPKSLRAELPELLWSYHMGIVLFWVHDRSPSCAASRRLSARTVEIVGKLVALSRLAPLRPLVRSVVGLMNELRDDVASAA